MTIPSWPAGLPAVFITESFSLEMPKGLTASTSPDKGPPIVRRRATQGVESVSGTIPLSVDQWFILRSFYLDDCAAGSIRFSWKHPFTDTSCEFRFTADTPPKVSSADGEILKVSIALEMLP